MKNLLRRLLPHAETHLLMGRTGAPPAPEPPAAGVEMLSIKSVSDLVAEALETFASANGFPQGWARAMLAEGASAVIARDATGAVLAMGWMTQQPFQVEEVGATIDPGSGVYLFGDFVAPAQRGRKLQRQLVAQRLRLTEGLAYACTLVHPSNVASVRSYRGEGFAVGGRFVRYRWRGRTWARCRTVGRGAVTFALDGTDRILVRGK
jgi:ribosomal protein S18 acetylase RimI-like enzyme